VIWLPYRKKHVRKLERIQRAATQLVPSLTQLLYEERLDKLKLALLEERRKKGDLIMMYKAVRGLENVDREDLSDKG